MSQRGQTAGCFCLPEMLQPEGKKNHSSSVRFYLGERSPRVLPASRVSDARAVEMDRCCILTPHSPNETHFSHHHFLLYLRPPSAVYGSAASSARPPAELHNCVPHRTLPTMRNTRYEAQVIPAWLLMSLPFCSHLKWKTTFLTAIPTTISH